jgi:aldehyde:ferredoxin oxidoreductase
MAFRCVGKILHVDLSTMQTFDEEQDEKFFRQYLGGSALSLYYLLKDLPAGVDPLGEDNRLVFATSIVTGVPVPGFNRYTVAAKSPMTGGFGESEAAGWWAPQLRAAGYVAVVVRGKAPHPVYLWIDDGEVTIMDASHLWGKDSGETQELIRQELGDSRVRVACIGQAGENLVRYACVLNDLKHVNGRSGLGAVMGSKNLKAVAVRGRGKPEFYDITRLREIARWFSERYKHNGPTINLQKFGTNGQVMGLNLTGTLPTRNFQEGEFEHVSEIDGEKLSATILRKREGCYGCPIRCKRVTECEDTRFSVDPKYGGPEYETLGAFGPNCGISDVSAIAKAHELCNRYTLDTISTGVTIAFTMECFEKGLITKEDTDGIELRFGNADAMLSMITLIAFRRGIGDLLAEGVKRAAESIGRGAEEFAMHVKGQELPLHEPRGKTGVGLGYAVSPTGADHLEAAHDGLFAQDTPVFRAIAPLGIHEPVSTRSMEGDKIRAFTYLQHLYSLQNCLGLCIYVGGPGRQLSLDKLIETIHAATGWETSLWELLKVGHRMTTMARLFNIREGFTREDDRLPERLHTPLKNGALKGAYISKTELKKAFSILRSVALSIFMPLSSRNSIKAISGS